MNTLIQYLGIAAFRSENNNWGCAAIWANSMPLAFTVFYCCLFSLFNALSYDELYFASALVEVNVR